MSMELTEDGSLLEDGRVVYFSVSRQLSGRALLFVRGHTTRSRLRVFAALIPTKNKTRLDFRGRRPWR
jgi:hypothetical protein